MQKNPTLVSKDGVGDAEGKLFTNHYAQCISLVPRTNRTWNREKHMRQ